MMMNKMNFTSKPHRYHKDAEEMHLAIPGGMPFVVQFATYTQFQACVVWCLSQVAANHRDKVRSDLVGLDYRAVPDRELALHKLLVSGTKFPVMEA